MRDFFIIFFETFFFKLSRIPYIQFLKRSLPKTVKIDFLTREEVASIPRNTGLFNHVYSIPGKKRSYKKQLFHLVMLLPRLLMQRYDVVIDLQNNEHSRMVRRALRPEAWSAFDRFSAIPGGIATVCQGFLSVHFASARSSMASSHAKNRRTIGLTTFATNEAPC